MNHVINRFIFNGVKDGSGTRLGLVMRRVFGVFEYEYGQWFVQVSAFRRRVTRRYLWDTTAFHVTADGAANRLFCMFPHLREKYIPDFIMVSARLCSSRAG